MKIKGLLVASLFAFGFMFTSCSNCVDCDCDDVTGAPAGTGGEICESDYDSEEDFNDAVDIIEAFGCECS